MVKTITFSNVRRIKKRTAYSFRTLRKAVVFVVLIVLQNNMSVAQPSGNAAVNKPKQTVLMSQSLSIEKRAALRILLSHGEGSSIAAYRLNDKSFLMESEDENAAETLRKDIERLYPEVKIEQVKNLGDKDGFVKVIGRVIKNEAGYPIYIVTGDNALDELSYRFEKETWFNNNPSDKK